MSRTEEKEERKKRALPGIPWLGGAARPSAVRGLAMLLESPAGLAATGALVAVTAGITIVWGPKIVDAISGERAGAPREGFWSAWYGRGAGADSAGPGSARAGSLEYLARANRGALPEAGAAEGEESAGGAAESAREPAAEPGEEGVASGSGEGAGAETSSGDAAAPGRAAGTLARGEVGRLSSSLSGGSSASGALAAARAAGAGAPASGATAARELRGAAGQRRLVAVRPGKGVAGGQRSALAQLRRVERTSAAGRALRADSARATEAAAFETGSAGGIAAEGPGVGAGGLEPGPGDSQPMSSEQIDRKLTPPDLGRSRNRTPYQRLLTMGRLLLLLADMLLFAAALASRRGMAQQAKLLAGGAIYLALIVVGIGYGLWTRHGQWHQGQILIASGGVAAGLAGLALAVGKWQPFLLALAGAASGAIGAVGVLTQPRLPRWPGL